MARAHHRASSGLGGAGDSHVPHVCSPEGGRAGGKPWGLWHGGSPQAKLLATRQAPTSSLTACLPGFFLVRSALKSLCFQNGCDRGVCVLTKIPNLLYSPIC